MRSKSLIAEIEAIFDERQEQIAEGASPSGHHLELPFPVSPSLPPSHPPPHFLTICITFSRHFPTTFPPISRLFPPQAEKCILEDAVGLIMYYTKIASSLNHTDAVKIRSFLTHTLPDLCYHQRCVCVCVCVDSL